MEIRMPESLRCDEGIKCPWCGHIERDSWEMNHESQDETECGRCELPITYIANVSVTWESFKGDTSEIPRDELEGLLQAAAQSKRDETEEKRRDPILVHANDLWPVEMEHENA